MLKIVTIIIMIKYFVGENKCFVSEVLKIYYNYYMKFQPVVFLKERLIPVVVKRKISTNTHNPASP